ncbi:hypothetical protein [Fulvivirga sedimenti]|uniref:Phosphate/sulfate permease n=1 Tax=Fulvivirga sedimenti TaxID=2879465 RepID=A0A9X1KZ71_9BACT|nr:hypothetical protein [Fulvivirga sedimenti]MCA6074371.1 hypothetical protein [Fulvivirga sedimenti]
MAANKANQDVEPSELAKLVYQIFDLAKAERTFLIIIGLLVVLVGAIYPYPQIAMWVGFSLAAYSAVANDSIQTIGTFIASNKKRQWYFLWLFMGLIFVATVAYSWITYNGDVTYQRLAVKGFSESPTEFNFLQLAAPIVLLVLTRARMPVSTTFLLLSSFSTKNEAIVSVITKSLGGYFMAFFAAILIWFLVTKYARKAFSGKPSNIWLPLQWITSGALWSFWIMQDAANIAIYLPRQLSTTQFIIFASTVFFGLGLLFYLKGDKIQSIVDEKAGVSDIRAATLVDFVYAGLIYYLKVQSNIPISTTWVFIGLLGGRELAIAINKKRQKIKARKSKKALRMIFKDASKAFIGLVISLLLAFLANNKMREQILEYFGY